MGSDASDEAGRGVDRRRALVGLGVGATAVWVAPVVISRSAASAATAQPCAQCSAELLDNGDAETGLVVPWATSGSHPFTASTWVSVSAVGITPLAGSGTFAFSATNSAGSTAGGSMTQDVAIDAGCASLPFTLTADLGAVAPDSFADVSAAIEFFDGSSGSLGGGGSSVLLHSVSAQATDTMTTYSTNGTVPVGTASAVVTVEWGGEGVSPYIATAAVDNISLVVGCNPP